MKFIGAIILAAGRSERLGSPKPLCKLGSRTFLDIAMENTEHPAITERVVVLGTHASAVGAAARPLRCVTNPDPDRGQTSSVKTGLGALSAGLEGIMIYPVDYPLVRGGDVDALIRAFDASDASIVVPSFGGRRGHPIVLAAALRPEVQALGGDEPLHLVIRRHAEGILHVERDHEGVLIDVDTPEDLDQARALLVNF